MLTHCAATMSDVAELASDAVDMAPDEGAVADDCSDVSSEGDGITIIIRQHDEEDEDEDNLLAGAMPDGGDGMDDSADAAASKAEGLHTKGEGGMPTPGSEPLPGRPALPRAADGTRRGRARAAVVRMGLRRRRRPRRPW